MTTEPKKISDAAASFVKVAAVHLTAAAELEGHLSPEADKAAAIALAETQLTAALEGWAPPERDEQEARGLLRALASSVPEVSDVLDVSTLSPVEAFHLVKQHLDEFIVVQSERDLFLVQRDDYAKELKALEEKAKGA